MRRPLHQLLCAFGLLLGQFLVPGTLTVQAGTAAPAAAAQGTTTVTGTAFLVDPETLMVSTADGEAVYRITEDTALPPELRSTVDWELAEGFPVAVRPAAGDRGRVAAFRILSPRGDRRTRPGEIAGDAFLVGADRLVVSTDDGEAVYRLTPDTRLPEELRRTVDWDVVEGLPVRVELGASADGRRVVRSFTLLPPAVGRTADAGGDGGR